MSQRPFPYRDWIAARRAAIFAAVVIAALIWCGPVWAQPGGGRPGVSAVPAGPVPGATPGVTPGAATTRPADPLAELARTMLQRPAEAANPATTGLDGTAAPTKTPTGALGPASGNPPAGPGTVTTPVNSNTTNKAAAPALLDPRENLPLGQPSPAPGHAGANSGAGANPGAGATGNAGSSSWWMTTAAALAVVVALIFIARAVFTRWSGRSGGIVQSPAIEVLSRITVAPRNHVLLVRLGGRILVLGDSTAGLRMLANIRDPEEVASILSQLEAGKSTSISGGFRQVLRRMNGDYQRRQADDEGAETVEFPVDRARDEVSGLTSRIHAVGQRGKR
jgi:flagellar biogenesis protein FliO